MNFRLENLANFLLSSTSSLIPANGGDYKMGGQSYHLTPHPKGWQVKAAGAKRASSVHETKKEALNAAKKLVSRKPSSLYIHGKNGVIQEERTYKKRDPHPPSG